MVEYIAYSVVVMTLSDAVQMLVLGPGKNFPVLTTRGLQTLFHEDKPKAFNKGIGMLIAEGLLERVTRGVYLNRAVDLGAKDVGTLVRYLRQAHLSYLSYESLLSEVGSISQIPMLYTFATTGESGKYDTRFATIEFTHTNRVASEILANTVFDEVRSFRVASPAFAYEDIQHARPTVLRMVNHEEHTEILSEYHMKPMQSHA